MAAVTICSDLGAQENKVCHYFHFFPIYLPSGGVTKCHDLSFLNACYYGTMNTINCGKFWKRWEYQTTWSASWEIYMQVRKQQLELDMEQQAGSK